jgi:hypothetical protein
MKMKCPGRKMNERRNTLLFHDILYRPGNYQYNVQYTGEFISNLLHWFNNLLVYVYCTEET